jgi:putative FmdB family regulatory protein
VPTYEYACEACDHQFEEFQSITAPPLKKCPVCGKPRLRRLIGTGGGVIFKGSGFYQTDYRSDSYKKAAEAETGSTASKSDSKDTKESKLEAASSSTTASPASDKTSKEETPKTPAPKHEKGSPPRKKKAG